MQKYVQLLFFITIMAELSFKLAKHIEKYQASISYKGNHIILKFLTDKSSIDTEVSRIISEKYMSGNLLKDFSLRKCKNNTSVFLGESSIDSIKCNGHIYELQLNRVRLEFNSDKHMDDGIIINLPPIEIEGLTKGSTPKTIKALGNEITFGYNDETTTCIVCPKDIQKPLVCLISLYYCHPIEILQEFKNSDANNQMEVTLRSQRRPFEDIGSRINLHVKANDVIEFIKLANTEHSHIHDLPRYVRQYIDSFVVSEPQRFNMLFAMASSFAEYILEKGKMGGAQLVEETISRFNNIESLKKVKDTIVKANLRRNGKSISTITELRNECEHNLYSNESYEFFANNPSVNVFMYDIACKIVMELAGIPPLSDTI